MHTRCIRLHANCRNQNNRTRYIKITWLTIWLAWYLGTTLHKYNTLFILFTLTPHRQWFTVPQPSTRVGRDEVKSHKIQHYSFSIPTVGWPRRVSFLHKTMPKDGTNMPHLSIQDKIHAIREFDTRILPSYSLNSLGFFYRASTCHPVMTCFK